MVYLEHLNNFWRCVKTGNKEVTISYGKLGNKGRTILKTDFKADKDAMSYLAKQTEEKIKAGYLKKKDPADATVPSSASNEKKRKRSSVRVGLAGYTPPEEEATKAVDSGLSAIDPRLASHLKIFDGRSARLVMVDVSKNIDKYYIVQTLVTGSKSQRGKKASKNTRSAALEYYVYSRWGRTGTGGQGKLDGPFAKDDEAIECYEKIFESKSGFAWGSDEHDPVPDKYTYVTNNINEDCTTSPSKWYYYLKNDPLGKPDDWYAYDDKNSEEVEQIYLDYVGSNKSSNFSTRLIYSESSGFNYKVCLQGMTQENTQSGTIRPISRSSQTPTLMPGASTVTKRKSIPKVKTVSPSPPKKVKTAAKVKKSGDSKLVGVLNVDDHASSSLRNGSVHKNYDVMLNQTNLTHNNNKFYKIQLIKTSGSFYLFTRWGRVGEPGATKEDYACSEEDGVVMFEKKFKSKTNNDWKKRKNFKPVTGKYSIVEMKQDGGGSPSAQTSSRQAKKSLPCGLDQTTQTLVNLIFDEDMFKTAMTAMNLDPQKLPLGALSVAQIDKGYKALEKIEEEINKKGRRSVLAQLTSDFYTIIPHSFGRRVGPTLTTQEMVSEKYEMLNTLGDIETAQSMQRNVTNDETSEELPPHPTDSNYQQLSADLELVDSKKDDEYRIIKTYLDDTSSKSYNPMKLRNVWRVNRHGEDKRFAAHTKLENRKLLWHGTSVAVVAAILKSGLRIMPHSGGRVGKGIYLADQHEKSAGYTSPAQRTCLMFLVEAALGKVHEIQRDDSSLVCAPTGFDSVLAVGKHAPPKSKDFVIDGRQVSVPHGKPVAVKGASSSSFYHNEFLIYKESQHRIRYVLAFDC